MSVDVTMASDVKFRALVMLEGGGDHPRPGALGVAPHAAPAVRRGDRLARPAQEGGDLRDAGAGRRCVRGVPRALRRRGADRARAMGRRSCGQPRDAGRDRIPEGERGGGEEKREAEKEGRRGCGGSSEPKRKRVAKRVPERGGLKGSEKGTRKGGLKGGEKGTRKGGVKGWRKGYPKASLILSLFLSIYLYIS
jgi:hypothetical protein